MLTPLRASAAQAAPPAAAASVAADRWMEIDLYWFNQQHTAESARQFWDRFQPLYAGVTGYRGVILNIGWTVGPVMEWSGRLDQRIALPTGSGEEKWVDESEPLTGTTAQRMRQWKARFAGARVAQRHGYDPWTYGDVQRLVAELKAEAARHGITDLKVGMLNFAWPDAYGEVAPWARKHPEAFRNPALGNGRFRYFDPAARLHADPVPLGGLPHGIAEAMPAHEAYAAQWGSLSRALGLDAIMLRDSFGMPVPYRRAGPWGRVAPSPQVIHRATGAVAALVKEVKLANPHALVMMYSNAASAIGDWRSNGFDLETIAKQGYLDIWVDQTWAGAWNEVGIREGSFWNAPDLGWTYQLASMLTHAAILADTKVRHYPLVETFDAWESWDVIHSAPERLRWGIWAYSHAAVKTPHGLRVPAGTYISWANQGERLLSAGDVHFLATNINAAVTDAHQITHVFGPTLVYSRSAMQWQIDHATPNHDGNEWIDEQMGSAAKWPVPMLSSTRLEWLPQVQSDLFVVQTPSHLPPPQLAALSKLIRKGQPVALVGSFSGGIDPSLMSLAHLSPGSGPGDQGEHPQLCKAANLDPGLVKNAPPQFNTYCYPEKATARPGARVLYTQEGAPALALEINAGQRLLLWDPPDLRPIEGIPLKEIWGNTGAPYALAAGALTDLLKQKGSLRADQIDLRQTMNVAAWTTRNGEHHILASNLEEGLRDDADHTRHARLVLPESWPAQAWKDAWTGHPFVPNSALLPIDLKQGASILIESSK